MTSANQPTQAKGSSRLKRLAYRLLRMVCGVYFFLCLILGGCQDWLIFPGASEQGKPESRIQFGGDATTLHLTTSNGIPITAVFGATGKHDTTRRNPTLFEPKPDELSHWLSDSPHVIPKPISERQL
jgi:hypothetical protein